MLERLAEFVGRVSDRNFPTCLFAVVVMITFGLFDYFADFAMLRTAMGPRGQAAAQAVFVGIGTGITALIFLLARRQRRQHIVDELRRVAELNHCLRNSLQIIMHAQHTIENKEEKRMTLEAINMIDTALKHLFPALGVERRSAHRSESQSDTQDRARHARQHG